MTLGSFVLLALAALPVIALCVLTGIGSMRRGDSPAVSVLSAAFFPVAWIAWYVKDNLADAYRGRA